MVNVSVNCQAYKNQIFIVLHITFWKGYYTRYTSGKHEKNFECLECLADLHQENGKMLNLTYLS
jgi:hypothetical protein